MSPNWTKGAKGKMKRNTFTNNSGGTKPVLRKGFPILLGGLVLVLAMAMLSGCSTPEATPSQPAVPEPPELSYSVTVSAVPIQISSGNLHWHRELPDDSYTLEDVALEIHNFGDFDVPVAQLEIRVDDDASLFNIDLVVAGGTKESIALQPMMAGFDGGIHRVYLSLLDDKGGVLYQDEGEDIGPLEPVAGSGSWHSMPS
jgi:hypothetical protein